MWKDKLWKNKRSLFIPHTLLKNDYLSTLGCGEKTVAALEKNTLFHINFLYGSCYYLNLSIYI